MFMLPLLVLGCAAYSKKGFKHNYIKLDQDKLNKISGNYSFYPKKRLGKRYDTIVSDSIKYNNLYQALVKEDWSKKIKFDSLRNDANTYSVSLKLKDNLQLNVKVLENGIIIRDTIIPGKFKKGMFYLNNKRLEIKGIPFLFGSYYNRKQRLAMTKNNNIIVNEAFGSEGGILLVFAAGYKYNSAFEYERLNF